VCKQFLSLKTGKILFFFYLLFYCLFWYSHVFLILLIHFVKLDFFDNASSSQQEKVYSLLSPILSEENGSLQSKFLRLAAKAHWYISNFTIHNDLQISFVTEKNT
jgi:hypothetical protein